MQTKRGTGTYLSPSRRELVNGRLQFRMVRGNMDSAERDLVLNDLNREQLMFRRR